MQGAPLGNPIRAACIREYPPTVAVDSCTDTRQTTIPLNLQRTHFSIVHNHHGTCLKGGPHRRTCLPRETTLRWLHTPPLRYSDSNTPGTTVPPWSRFGHLEPSLQVVSILQIVCAAGHCSSLREQAVMHMRLCSEEGRPATLFGYKAVTQGFFRPRHETPIPSKGVDWRSESYTLRGGNPGHPSIQFQQTTTT
jgi:hypothetical protein